MGALGIFICHECRVATKRPTKNTENHLVKVGYRDQEILEAFKAEHPGHDCIMQPDAHGQISPEDYDFDKREFKFEGY